ncbi:uncharacterized protein GIQ15_00531 [Arthroderma uncinatum]|uniref:uncharacterized protein n=1 Tax=Arthroderma uncinatum TaxID=74035 RepID=UPI00144AD043|nr:uncharacterized protein GIQ15_00531 [Arthroderma uncinatum]KAF3491014.1 hypothetical protein GIQ15_00531 [Arthroderma uncinatum]
MPIPTWTTASGASLSHEHQSFRAASTPGHSLDINCQSELFGNALYAAAALCNYYGHIPWLISHGANVNQTGGRWHTPFRAAVEGSQSEERLDILIQLGACANLQGGEGGRTALMANLEKAALHANYQPSHTLMDQTGIDLTLIDDAGQSLLHYYCRLGMAYHIDRLLKHRPASAGVDINKISDFGTPLLIAIRHEPYGQRLSRGEAVKALLTHGADLHIADKNGMSPAMLAQLRLSGTYARMVTAYPVGAEILMWQNRRME